jgi:hypothetical protein
MRRTALFLTAAALVVGTTRLSAQAPNFAGTWTLIVDPNAPPPGGGRMGGGGGGPLTITQDSKTLTISRTNPNGTTQTVYNLDGTDSKNMMGGGGGQTEVISHAKWDGSKLVVTTTRDMNGMSMTTTAAYSLDASGNLSVATTRPPRGGTGDPVTTTQSYKKS